MTNDREHIDDKFLDMESDVKKYATTSAISATTEQRVWQLRRQPTSVQNIVVVVL